jgi:HAD superfamily hydrolase (TIGR01509 family)
MFKLIIFDLDGVLVNAKEIHYRALNDAILNVTHHEPYMITWDEHLSTYDGLKTRDKLSMLTKKKKLHPEYYDAIWNRKQELTLEALHKLEPDNRIKNVFIELRNAGYKIACCTNSIRRSTVTSLSRLGLIEYIDIVITNEDVRNPKPHPEMYWKAMSMLDVLPEETLIIEDSPVGLLAAYRSNGNVIRVNNPADITLDFLFTALQTTSPSIQNKWQDNKMNVLIPMAGAGSRFFKAGYTFPKPLIDVNGKPMIQLVVDNLNVDANFIYVVQKEHRERFNLDTLLNLITPNCKIIEVEGVTEGAACTTLLAADHIDNDHPLLIANSDQFVEWNSNEFLYKMNEQELDGGIVSFKSTHPKWSFAKVNEYGYVTEVAEKNPISDIATVGIYYWARGRDYVKYANEMIANNLRVNNEFYVCPVFNLAIQDGKKIKTFSIKEMWGLGTPEDLSHYLEHHK